MIFIEILLIGAALAMDAFAVSVCEGLSMKTLCLKRMLVVALCFGVFQALMPTIGYFVGKGFEKFITPVDHWIAFLLLLLIGGKMIIDVIRESKEGECECCEGSLSIFRLLVMAVATSIDALATGITLPTVLGKEATIWAAVSVIGVTTFFICLIGVLVGNRFGMKYKNKATLTGGIVLVLIGANILSKHLFGIGL